MTLREEEVTVNLKRKRWIAQCGELAVAVESRLRNEWMFREANIGLSRAMTLYIFCIAIFDHTIFMGTL